jgi:hypothetical protein
MDQVIFPGYVYCFRLEYDSKSVYVGFTQRKPVSFMEEWESVIDEKVRPVAVYNAMHCFRSFFFFFPFLLFVQFLLLKIFPHFFVSCL